MSRTPGASKPAPTTTSSAEIPHDPSHTGPGNQGLSRDGALLADLGPGVRGHGRLSVHGGAARYMAAVSACGYERWPSLRRSDNQGIGPRRDMEARNLQFHTLQSHPHCIEYCRILSAGNDDRVVVWVMAVYLHLFADGKPGQPAVGAGSASGALQSDDPLRGRVHGDHGPNWFVFGRRLAITEFEGG